MRDKRDPQKLGELYLVLRQKHPDHDVGQVMRELAKCGCDDYDAEHIGPLEKYGDPRALPSTLPN